MLEVLETTFAVLKTNVMYTANQVNDLVYYHPAWSILGMMFLYHTFRWIFWDSIKKRFTPEKCTNVLITGGAQGLGKLLTEQFIRRHLPGSVNLIVVDIRGDLEAQLIKDIKVLTGDIHFKFIHFY